MDLKELEEKLEQTTTALNNAQLNFEDTLSKTGNLQKEIDDKNKKILSLDANINERGIELNKMSEMKIKLSKDIADLSDKNNVLSKDNEKIIGLVEYAQMKVDSLIAKYKDKEKSLVEEHNKAVLNLTMNRDRVEREAKNLSNKNDELLAEIQSRIEVVKGLDEQKTILEDRIKELSEEKVNAELFVTEKAEELLKANESLSDVLSRLSTSKELADKEYSDREQMLIATNSDIENAKKELDKVLLKSAQLLAKEDYLRGQEEDIKNKFNRLGLEFQPYA